MNIKLFKENFENRWIKSVEFNIPQTYHIQYFTECRLYSGNILQLLFSKLEPQFYNLILIVNVIPVNKYWLALLFPLVPSTVLQSCSIA
jgi:hypothetical protein